MSSIRAPQPAAPAQAKPQGRPAAGGGSSFFGNLGFPGLLSMIAGLAICGSFLLPWLTANLICTDPLCSTAVIKTLHFPTGAAASPTGFSIAIGSFAPTTGGPSGPIQESFTFPLLWAVFLVGLLLIALPVLMAVGRVDAKRARVSLLVISLLALAVEVAYGLGTSQALPRTRAGVAALLNGLAVTSGRQAAFNVSTGPGLGFWVALAATLVAIGVSIYGFYAASATQHFDASIFLKKVGLAGQIALVAALALLVVFFLPWFSITDPANPGSAWSQATNGVQLSFFGSGGCILCQAPQVNIFPYLWLIPLAALGLVGIVWLLNQGVLWRRLAAILICVALLVALLVEVSYLLEVQSLHAYAEQALQATGLQLTSTTYNVTWGFWVTMALTGVALLVSSFLLLGRHKSVTGRLGTP